jgi:hypothetical protein
VGICWYLVRIVLQGFNTKINVLLHPSTDSQGRQQSPGTVSGEWFTRAGLEGGVRDCTTMAAKWY